MHPDKESLIRQSFTRSPLMVLYGAEMTEVKEGYLELALKAKPELMRRHGMFHGGVIAGLADTAGGYAVATLLGQDPDVVTVEFKINYLRPATGEVLTAKATVLKQGKTLAVVRVDLYTHTTVGGETHVATALFTFMPRS